MKGEDARQSRMGKMQEKRAGEEACTCKLRRGEGACPGEAPVARPGVWLQRVQAQQLMHGGLQRRHHNTVGYRGPLLPTPHLAPRQQHCLRRRLPRPPPLQRTHAHQPPLICSGMINIDLTVLVMLVVRRGRGRCVSCAVVPSQMPGAVPAAVLRSAWGSSAAAGGGTAGHERTRWTGFQSSLSWGR